MLVRLRFDGPSGPEAPRFIEAEDLTGHSIGLGHWEADADSGDWFLVIAVDKRRVRQLVHAASVAGSLAE